ncbi:hypothetical protein XENTR_v10001222 [Xenopus tropicalis]|uniref:SH2 domain-containing protein 4A n=1 Tax=Xenopus tropicalis TaxID=8364 RepID=A0A6I8SVF2_XENTR|nr:SH2 domain-containing protein 4A isoform X2 [Xenopus tropicalis]KAE8631527.1 hypothetical protein XENTR_v10001222 [Xenopus tropicalis]KAE8631528.1 hypothetical protein XENTR_v10001222 [Xenopus tropicalis]
MLKQILADMYIDPELLAELSEEQKQILFFKMRQEQIRRWQEWEAKCDQNEDKKRNSRPRKACNKSVHWRFGTDQEVWVWVMGEHSSDKPYDQICDEIIAEQARREAEKEAEQLRKKQEVELSQLSTLRLHPHNNADLLKKNTDTKQMVNENVRIANQQIINDENQKKENILKEKENDRLQERTQEIYMNWKEAQEVKQKLEKEDKEWQESLRKSKLADERRRSVAKQARDDYKRLSMQGINRGKVADTAKTFGAVKRPPIPPKPKLPPPANNSSINRMDRRQGIRRLNSAINRENIIKWFKEEQLPLKAGWDKSGSYVEPWFHGIISRQESEQLLGSHGHGSFLLRVSEKIQGYVLSYCSEEGCAHFLIDASATSYSFLGVDQLQHTTLADLVEYHKTEPIPSLGRELLRFPCGQKKGVCDYSDLLE